MNLSLVIRRARREWRQLGILTLALCLVTAFFSLGPLYVRAAVQSGLKYEIDALQRTNLRLTLNNPQPWKLETWDYLNNQIGPLVGSLTRISQNAQPVPSFGYSYGEPLTDFSGRTEYNYYVFAFSNLQEKFKLIDGRWPERLPPPDASSRTFKDEQDQLDKGLGMYSTGEVEAVVTPEVASQGEYEVGTRVVIGLRAAQAVVIHIVGIVEPANPADPFFANSSVHLATAGIPGEITVTGKTPYTPSVIVLEGAYNDWIIPGTALNNNANQTFTWDISLNPTALDADTITDYRERMTILENQLSNQYPGLFITDPLLDVLNNYADLVSKTEGPIVLLSGAVLIMMLYHLVSTVNLVLEQQMGEWASMSSRGASTRQLVLLQAQTMLLIGVFGFIVGPLLAFVILVILAAVGPMATATGGVVPIGGIPRNAFILSAVAAVLGVLMLTLPAIPAARRSLAQFKQAAARPPSKPLWSRFFLDFVLILLGIAFIARLLFYVEGDLQQTLSLLASNPQALIQLIIDSANRSGGLSDPLNLLGPALLLTGIALLWLRLFPALMRLIGAITGRSNGLTGPLAVWNVEREPGHYAQLVLLLIGTLALGTAALALGTTRDQGAWSVARTDTGGSARVELASTGDANKIAANSDLGITATSAVLTVPTDQSPGRIPITILGVDPQSLGAAIPEAREGTQPLIGNALNLVSGIQLPTNAVKLSLAVYTQSKTSNARLVVPEAIYVWLIVADQNGGLTRIPLSTPSFAYDTWNVYTGDLGALAGQSGLVINGIEFAPYIKTLPMQGNTVNLDSLQSLDTSGAATMLYDFEQPLPDWNTVGAAQVFDVREDNRRVNSGTRSSSITYLVQRTASDPTDNDPAAQSRAFQPVRISAISTKPIPVVMSARMAKDLGEAARRERLPLEVGMTGQIDLPIRGSKIKLNFQIVAIVRSFPTLRDNQQFMLMDQHTALQLMNTSLPAEQRFNGPTQVWLEMDARQPDAALDGTLRRTTDVANIAYAWDRYNVLLREPLPAALAGMLYAGFWVSLLLSLLDFAFYLVVTARRRSLGFAVLRSLGWNVNNIWLLLIMEQAALVIPALLVGILLGAVLAYVILPFLALVGGQTLIIPTVGLIALVLVLLGGFGVLSFGAARWLRQLNVNQVLRLGEE